MDSNEGKKPSHWAKPFEVTRDDEDRAKDTDRNLTIRLNEEDQKLLREACELFNSDQEGAVIKRLWRSGWNAVCQTLGPETVRWIESPTRTRKRSRHRKGGENAVQENAKL